MVKLSEFYEGNIRYCVENEISKLVMFIKTEQSILDVKAYLEENKIDLKLVAVTFPANEKIYELIEDNKLREFVPEAADGNKIKDLLRKNDITLISSALPFEGIVIPGGNYNPYQIIEQTLSMVHIGLPNLIQTLLIATDNGIILPKQRVVVMNSALAIDALGTNTRLLFHPEEGMKINKIIY